MRKLTLLFACLLVAVWGCAQVERITASPTVESATENSATIAWSTDTGGSSIVHYGTDPNNLNQTAESPYVTGANTHRVVLRNLKPNTTYYFYVQSTQGQSTGTAAKSAVGQFQTLGEAGTKIPLFRLVDAHGGHFYTTSYAEEQTDERQGWKPEGTTGYLLKAQEAGTEPLYRLVDSRGDHFFTTNAARMSQAERAGYHSEGVAGYVATTQQPGTVPLYDLYDAKAGLHFYTSNPTEKDSASARGYRVEGIAGYVWQH
jgi:uncharacterized protein YceK